MEARAFPGAQNGTWAPILCAGLGVLDLGHPPAHEERRGDSTIYEGLGAPGLAFETWDSGSCFPRFAAVQNDSISTAPSRPVA